MGLNRFREFYERVGFLQLLLGILLVVLVTYSLFIVFTVYVGPYVVGLWLAGII